MPAPPAGRSCRELAAAIVPSMSTGASARTSAVLPAPGGGARDRLLARVADFVLENGVSDLSLSELARRVGSNNRMLLYYFSSKEELLGEACGVAITRFPYVDDVMVRLDTGPGPLRDRLLQVWDDIAQPENLPFLSLFFQAFAVALYRPGRSAAVTDLMGGKWVPEVRVALEHEGYASEAALTVATEVVAALRGLQFALLSGTDRGVLDRAYRDLVAALPSPSTHAQAE